MIGMSIFMFIMGFFGRWFFTQREYQARIWKASEIQDNFRRANWEMIKEIQLGRTIIWPRVNSDFSIKSDSKVIIKSFFGDYIAYYHVPETGEIRRCLIPNGVGAPQENAKPIAVGIASATFTAVSVDHRLLSIHLTATGAHSLDAVYLLNSD
jgi:hypothetical protein